MLVNSCVLNVVEKRHKSVNQPDRLVNTIIAGSLKETE